MKRLPLIASFILFIALCISAAYWAMQLFKPPVRAVVAPPQAVQPALKLDVAAGLFGGHANTGVASDFQLKGVVVASNPAESVAILAANGKPARAIRTNKEVMPGVTVKEINRRYVLLLEGGVIKRVELPAEAKVRMKVGVSTYATGAGSLPVNYPGPSAEFRPSPSTEFRPGPSAELGISPSAELGAGPSGSGQPGQGQMANGHSGAGHFNSFMGQGMGPGHNKIPSQSQ